MRYLFFCWVFILSFRLSAQPYSISQLSIEEGLSNSYVIGITQDRDGFLWFATEEGLNKFDGSRFISYYKHTQSISGNELNRIYADPVEPVVWVATQRAGLNAYNYKENRLEVFSHDEENPFSIITNDVTDIKQAVDGNLWVSTYHHGIDYFHRETRKFAHYNTHTVPSLQSDKIWTFIDNGDGTLFLGHAGQGMTILSIKDKQARNFRNQVGVRGTIPGNNVRCIYKDSHGNVWVGTEKGLSLFNAKTETFVIPDNLPNGLLTSYVFSICQMDDDRLWVGTELNDVYIIDLKQNFFSSSGDTNIEHLTVGNNKYSLSNPTVRAIFQDGFSNVWIGTYGGGVNFIGSTPPLFNNYSYSPIPDDINSLNNRIVLSLCTDAENNLWMGTDGGGINIFKNGVRKVILNKESGDLTHNSILSIFRDSRDNIWIGSFLGGINYYNHQTKKISNVKLDGVNNQDVRCFFEDNNHRIWVGTRSGLYVLDIETQKVLLHYNKEENNLPDNLIRSINQDAKGRMWVGTFGRGLAVYSSDMKEIAVFNEDNGFCSNTITYIFKDSHNRMWIATGEGLVCFPDTDSLDFRVFLREDGLPNTYIRAITEDNVGNIWISTNGGISCFLTEQKEFKNYNSFNKKPMGSFMPTAIRDRDGIVYFGSINGVWYFNPSSVLQKREVGPVNITEMKIYAEQSAPNSPLSINYFRESSDVIKLNHKQNTFSITFNISDYSLAKQVDYAYKLRGLDDVWYIVEDNTVMLRNIHPGEYEFQIRARVKNQDWGNDITSLPIHIAPPLWLTWWAKTIYFLVVVAVLFALLYAYKKKVDIQSSYELEKKNYEQEQELNNERLRFYTNITHELRTPLTLILGPLEDMQKDTALQPKQIQKVSVVYQSAVRLLNLINQILEFRKTETQNKKLCVSKSNIATLVQEVGIKYKELNQKHQVQFSISIENENMPMYFDREIVTIILDNLISNAIKYTEKGKIGISLYTTTKQEVSYTHIEVSDTGHGIEPEVVPRIFDRYYQAKSEHQASGTGIGLALVRNLVGLHEGFIHVESGLNKGSKFCFTLLTHNIYPDALHAESEKASTNLRNTDEKHEWDKNVNGTKPILLIVEDNIDIRNYIVESFNGSFDIITAENGQRGMQVAIERIPDIIVSDIMMPVMDGVALCKAIKEDVQTSHIPVILLTAKDTLQDKELGYTVGADSYLTKPFSASLLHSRINNLLESRKKLASQIRSNLDISNKSETLSEALNKLDNEFVQRLTTLTEENLSLQKIDIGYLSDKMCMSSSTLYRKVKALTGISTNEFIRKIKMKNAERLLLEGKYTISEISFMVGMNSPVYFRTCFKEEFGVSPREYLRNIGSS